MEKSLYKKGTKLLSYPLHVLFKSSHFSKCEIYAYFLYIEGANINSVVKHIGIFAKNLLILNTLCYGTFICIITQILARYFR